MTYKYACLGCGIVEDVEEKIGPELCWMCVQCDTFNQDRKQKRERLHCFHLTDLGSVPPIKNTERCCFCGKTRVVDERNMTPDEVHGAHQPKWRKERVNGPLVFDNEECPSRTVL